jgi:hypothetical protein
MKTVLTLISGMRWRELFTKEWIALESCEQYS